MQTVESKAGFLSAFLNGVKELASQIGSFVGRTVVAICDELKSFIRAAQQDLSRPRQKPVAKRQARNSRGISSIKNFATNLAKMTQPKKETRQGMLRMIPGKEVNEFLKSTLPGGNFHQAVKDAMPSAKTVNKRR